MMLGKEVWTTAEVMFNKHIHEANMTYRSYLQKLKERMQCALYIAHTHLQNVGKKMKLIYNAKVKSISYGTDELV